ncbi:MAG: protein kinase [Polyangiaceae bacterium]|nr:protein kinase [Polyangiaceae bacterium]
MSSDLSPGAVFAGRYRIERRIASGGMGSVYEVVHLETNRRRALKVLHANLVQSEELRARFRQEARVAAEIESEYIVDVFDAGIDAATEMPFLVMELLRGEDIRERIRRTGPLPPEEAVRCLFEASLALDKTHQARIVHRDLKPDNLYLTEREHGLPRVKVLDFGIAKIVADGTMNGQTRESLGTPLYMAPEQFLMTNNISPATDVFALGLIAYTMLVGKSYWFEESRMAGAAVAFALHASRGPQESAVARAARHGVMLPPAFDAWFFRATAANPANRYQVASAAVVDLAQALGVPFHADLASASRTGPGARFSSGIGVVAPYRPPMQSVPPGFSNTPLPSLPTPIGSGLTNAGPPSAAGRNKSIVAIAAGAVVTMLIGSIVIYQLFSTASAPAAAAPEPAAPLPVTSVSAALAAAEPDVKPVAPVEASAAPSASAAAAPTAKTTTTAKPKVTADKPVVRPTAAPTTTTKKPAGSAIWNND